jgi:hypothetical protein
MSSRRTTDPQRPVRPPIPVGTWVLYGCGAGLLGVAAYVLSPNSEISLTEEKNDHRRED